MFGHLKKKKYEIARTVCLCISRDLGLFKKLYTGLKLISGVLNNPSKCITAKEGHKEDKGDVLRDLGELKRNLWNLNLNPGYFIIICLCIFMREKRSETRQWRRVSRDRVVDKNNERHLSQNKVRFVITCLRFVMTAKEVRKTQRRDQVSYQTSCSMRK